MANRRPVDNGHVDFDDGSDDDVISAPATLAPYVPPRIGFALSGRANSFQMPRSGSSSARGSVRPGSAVSSTQPTPTPEPNFPNSGSDVAIVRSTSADIRTSTLGEIPAVSLGATHNRSTLALERQINMLATAQEEYQFSNDEQHSRTNEKLNRLIDAVNRLVPSNSDEYSAPTDMPRTLTPSYAPPPTQASYVSNPPPTPTLIAIVSKVVAETRARVGKKKGGADDNSIKEHARNTFYRMLGISAARTIQPFFEDEYGEPDTLPAKFADPETGYCQPYLHWKAALTKQTAWIGTYILRFRSTIPNDQSELSILLRSQSDEQIVILLHDGPFKLCQAVWRDFGKTEEEIEMMRSNARRYQRADRKAAVRAKYITAIPSLQDSNWEYMYHSGYVSQDESDDDDDETIVTRRPEYRSQWENKLYDAIQVAEREKAKTRPGLCPRPLPHQVVITRLPIPQLERGTRSSKVVVRIALAGISKVWSEKNPDDFKKFGPLINVRASTKPDISAFLAKYPASLGDDDNLDATTNDGQQSNRNMPDIYNTDAYDDGKDDRTGEVEMERDTAWVGDSNESARPSQGEGRLDGQRGGTIGEALVSGEEGNRVGIGAGHVAGELDPGYHTDIPVDPQLASLDVYGYGVQPGAHIQPRPKPKQVLPEAPPARGLDAIQATSPVILEPATTQASIVSVPIPGQHPAMPAPPPLVHYLDHPEAADDEAQPPKKRTRLSAKENPAKPSTSQPKKRGRPPGSKNKPKNAGV